MLSGGKPAAVMVSRNGVLRLFQTGTPRPCLSLPRPVSTTMRRVGVSTTSEWIDIFSRPSSVAKCGISQGSFWISSLVAAGRMKRVEPTVSISTILVILTLPTVHGMRRSQFSCFRERCGLPPSNAMDHLSRCCVIGGTPRQPERATMPELAISAEKVAFIIEKAREFDVKEAASDPDSGSNPSDDDEIDVLEDTNSDPVAAELSGFIRALNEDEQLDLVTMMWLGRGDGEVEEWDDLRARAAEARGEYKNPRRETVQYLLGEPMLGDLLADGMDELGIDWSDERTTPVT